MVIVTQNQYILATKIHHITMDEQYNHTDGFRNGKRHTFMDRYYQVTVIYTPEDSTPNNSNSLRTSNNEMRECSVIVRGVSNAHSVFKNLIQQIREQMPDQLYLDTALERMIANFDVEEAIKDEEKDARKYEEVKSVASTKKVRRTGKAKRASKKVLRKPNGRR
jgi:choline kinase